MYDKFIQSYRAARRAGCPIIAVNTPDPSAALDRIKSDKVPQILWDRVRGLRAYGEQSEEALADMLGGADGDATKDPVGVLAEFAPRLVSRGVLYCFGVGRYLAETSVDGAAYVQAVWNLRDDFKATGRCLVLFASAVVLPPELKDDVVVLDEPLPGDAELEATITGLLGDNDVPAEKSIVAKAVTAVRGLATFSAEQALAMAINGKTLDTDELWSKKRQLIAQTPGLAIWQGGETFDDVGGCDAIKEVIDRNAKGRDPFDAVLWWDEVEKMFAGATAGTSDSSGVAQGQLGAVLTWQQEANDRGASGILEVGAPGSGKSLIAKAAGNTYGVPTLYVDLGAMKGSLVGESEAKTRQVLKIIDVVARRPLVIMTCNKQIALPPELKRRLTGGIFYFDLPTESEQAVIWRYYIKKYDLDPKQALPPHAGWTGAEIKQACVLAYKWGVALTETVKFIVPVAKSAEREIDALREQANNTFLSASRPGIYQRGIQRAEVTPSKRRVGVEV